MVLGTPTRKSRISADGERLCATPILSGKGWREIKRDRELRSPNKWRLDSSLDTRPLLGGKERWEPSPAIQRKVDIGPRRTGDLSTMSAAWTVLNIFVGLGLLSKPYAIAKGGWVSLILLAFVTTISNWTAKKIVDCFNHPDCAGTRSYSEVANKALGFPGVIVLLLAITFELLGALSITLVSMWQNLAVLIGPQFPGDKVGTGISPYIIVISSVCALPTIWILRLSEMSGLQFLGFFSSCLIVLTMAVVRATYGELGPVNAHETVGPDVSLSMGIFVLSLAGHASLPQIYYELENKESFDKMINFCFFFMFIIYAGCGATGYLIYGDDTKILVSVNMVSNPGGILPAIMTGVIVAKNFFTIAPLVSVLCDSSEIIMGIGEKPKQQRLFRSVMYFIAVILAWLCQNALPFLESLTGGICTMMTSFICPTVFSLLLYRGQLSYRSLTAHYALFFFGVIMAVLLTYGAIRSLFAEK